MTIAVHDQVLQGAIRSFCNCLSHLKKKHAEKVRLVWLKFELSDEKKLQGMSIPDSVLEPLAEKVYQMVRQREALPPVAIVASGNYHIGKTVNAKPRDVFVDVPDLFQESKRIPHPHNSASTAWEFKSNVAAINKLRSDNNTAIK